MNEISQKTVTIVKINHCDGRDRMIINKEKACADTDTDILKDCHQKLKIFSGVSKKLLHAVKIDPKQGHEHTTFGISCTSNFDER